MLAFFPDSLLEASETLKGLGEYRAFTTGSMFGRDIME